MANVGRVEDASETSLAAATAEIITARWTGAGRRARDPEKNGRGVNGHGTEHAAPVSPGPPTPSMFTPTIPPPRTPEPAYTSDVGYASDPGYLSDVGYPSETGYPPETGHASARVGAGDDFGFRDSVMSDLAFPKLLLPDEFDLDHYGVGSGPGGYGHEESDVRQHNGRRNPLQIDTEALLPQRVPGAPDVPSVVLPPNDPLLDPSAAPAADGAELTRIADVLRQYDIDRTAERTDGFDLAAVLEAVRSVPDVRDAQLRWNSESGHTLRIEFVDGVDEGQVTRQVARLLRETLGLAAQPSQTVASGRRTGTEHTPSRGMARLPRAGVVASAPVPVRSMHPAPDLPADLDRSGGRPMPPRDGAIDVARVVLDHVQVTTLGVDATVDVRMVVSGTGPAAGRRAVGKGHGPAVDAYLLRLAATAATDAIDQLLVEPGAGEPRGRCYVEHVAVVPFGGVEVAVVVILLVCGSSAEQLAGSAIVAGDPRQAVASATLSAVNRRLESLLA